MSQELLSFIQRIDQRLITEKTEYLECTDGQNVKLLRSEEPQTEAASCPPGVFIREKFRAALLRRFRIIGRDYQQSEFILGRWFRIRWDSEQFQFLLEELDEANPINILNSYVATLKPLARDMSPAPEGTSINSLVGLTVPVYAVHRALGESNVMNYDLKTLLNFTPYRIMSENVFMASYTITVPETAVFDRRGDLALNLYLDSEMAKRRRAQLDDMHLILN